MVLLHKPELYLLVNGIFLKETLLPIYAYTSLTYKKLHESSFCFRLNQYILVKQTSDATLSSI